MVTLVEDSFSLLLYLNPDKKRANNIIQKCGARADSSEKRIVAHKLRTIDFRRPIESARKPHKCAVRVNPRNGKLMRSPFLEVVSCKSQVATGIIKLIPRTSRT